MTGYGGRFYTIPPGAGFVDALAGGLIEMTEGDPLRLAATTILLPTRRAARALREAFLRGRDGEAMLLPRMATLGDLDSDEIELTGASDDPGLPPAMPPLRRQLLLARLILARDGEATSPEQAAGLALELGRLLDQMAVEGIALDRLKTLVPDEYAAHWQKTLAFLDILFTHWPVILEQEGAMDAADRRDRLLRAQAERWRARPPFDPVIVAGTTGSVPATADLIATVVTLPQGKLILPGLDAEAGADLPPTHPQFGLHDLLRRLEVPASTVAIWPAAHPTATGTARGALLRAALDPEPEPAPPEDCTQALAGLHRLDCLDPNQEAGIIALIMRETLERPGETCALVTPDRGLARRVAAELARWDVELDDSAGMPLPRTRPGMFLRLVADACAENLAPAPLLALLKHPLAAAGMAPAELRRAARRLDLKLRGPRPAPGFTGLLAAGADPDLVGALERCLAPFATLLERPSCALGDLVRAHVAAAEALARTADQPGEALLWQDEEGREAADLVADLLEAGGDFPALAGRDYPALFDQLAGMRAVRAPYGRHPRLFVWSPLEARLQQPDRMILGGLNEGTWPAEPPADPWLGRQMRRTLGLPEPERRIGLSAHDFAQGFGAPELFLTRAERVDGAPTVPARWLQRLDTLLRAAGHDGTLVSERSWFSVHQALDRPDQYRPVPAPEPRPPLAARPRKLSVTRIETLMRDPYQIYARYVLRLRRLDPLDADPGAADRGLIIHEALDRFVRAYPGDLPPDALEHLLAVGRDSFGATLDHPGVAAFWWPRFERIARWFVEVERARRPGLERIWTEVKGSLVFEAPGGPFELEATADRIDRDRDGRLTIIDYKTGQPPSPKRLEDGTKPQLPLEAWIATAGGFPDVPAAEIAGLAFWRLSGGALPGEIKAIAGTDLEAAAAGLKALIAAFDDPATPYRPLPRPDLAGFNDYAHLARLREWGGGLE